MRRCIERRDAQGLHQILPNSGRHILAKIGHCEIFCAFKVHALPLPCCFEQLPLVTGAPTRIEGNALQKIDGKRFVGKRQP